MDGKTHLRTPQHLIRIGRARFPFLRNVEKREATATLAEYVEEVREGPVVVTVRGRPVAFLARVTGIDLEDLSMCTDAGFIEVLRRARARSRANRTISFEELKRKSQSNKTKRGAVTPNGKKRRSGR